METLLKAYKVPEARSEEESWKVLQERISEDNTKVIPLWKRPLVWGAAAAVALILAAGFFFEEGAMHSYTAKAVDSVTLPDGSLAQLNSGSLLEWSDDWSGERLLRLDGEAFFEVKKGEKFTVETAQGNVQVLGTSFNVYTTPTGMRVDCFSGRVAVSKGGEEVILTKGQAVKMANGTPGEVFEIAQVQPSWLLGSFNYTNASLERVVRDIEQRFGVTVERPDGIDQESFSGSFPDNSADECLELVAKAMELSVEKSGENAYRLMYNR